MVTFVLVPGAWLGGWCWKHLTPLLTDEGHEVYTPTLTGLGERTHLARPGIDLQTHIRDIVNVLEYEDLEDVVLVGHSYAGLVVLGVAEEVPERLAHVVYLDALVPMDDEPVAAADFYPPEELAAMEAAAADNDGGWPMPDDHPGWVGISDEDAQWMREKAVPHPLHTFEQAVAAENPDTATVPHTYILCLRNGIDDGVLEAIRQLCDQRAWDRYELETGHWPMVSVPDELSTQLLELL
ncbi:alpha/beta hydrolase (plasmid) [Haloferax mediterranei ATCC 33500]|uniref:Alpha/beta hydrolase n=1 Tax=Haloferax mediterranei (strain ATCC 33500 / DSM 1411 / JCM 8866 / NBRC 14739 / NCIMB 2177 / R-4) TaxID=523841 RepID=I3R9X8_HALMT|nr:alpha/beta hydrolase [Haloferax mediterranei]AFK21038.1 putative esterase [Haloferax mediterranei ATCC 33500]AHZ24101.1 esterase [Haloferax mediterranei ATCC 33500]EMA05176.1 putative esterase [Haloferax mediterranei ATCC 33500]MDX5989749.1 alpha/beta hydrolase [Haloferax mediterranei ATCC 33500]QCQ77199.1 alpha/beta hydrolase [Haloferax mediterranei ATCC 33500]